MNPEAQRIAIAQACGYRKPEGDEGCWYNPPDYLNDLNAMHEAEKTLEEKAQLYTYVLHEITLRLPHEFGREPWIDMRALPAEGWFHRPYSHAFKLASATASQKAEAFLRALNLWHPSQPTTYKPGEE